jgi:Concanavalin A-like lectin/glucanases superfamily/Peptide-N-glycosidase F, C terminal/Secretion system C-terminal sorting domain
VECCLFTTFDIKFHLVKQLFSFLILFFAVNQAFAQNQGDTLYTQTFVYGSATRDTLVQFPNLPGVTYEKILMLYNMRCKDGLVSPGIAGQTNIGCGEWDYTCNTYIVDSTRIDSSKAKHPTHIVSGNSGTTYNYTTQPTFSYYQFTQQQVTNTSVINETESVVGLGNTQAAYPLNTGAKSAKSQYIWTAAELGLAGLTAGPITGLRLDLLGAGNQANYLKIKMVHSQLAELDNAMPMTNLSEVYFLNTPLAVGSNQLNFHTPFIWNGTDNIVIEFSFNNSISSLDCAVSSDETPFVSGLISGQTDYSLEFGGTQTCLLGDAGFGTFTYQISFAFWQYGNPDFLPANTSAVYANSVENFREVNVHLPWSNSNVYWDCGTGGSYDRIEKLATTTQFEGKWNHWVFTKNKTTGSMKIFYNGALWHSGTGFTKNIEISTFMLGSGPELANPYFGKIDDFSLWNTELTAATIQAWMYRDIDAAHPNFANLVAYYPMNEGAGNTVSDESTNNETGNVNGTGAIWHQTRGGDMFKNFNETNIRPKMSFVSGEYTQTINDIVSLDSLQNIPNRVINYASQNNNIVALDTNYYYKSGFTYIFDGATGAKIDSIAIATQNTINITQLDYYSKIPSTFQIMSFVTPYGINLDLGMVGKTYTFDVTDLSPVLKGGKRIFMNGGGQFQEQMDIRFMFIVGTPPRNIVDVQNLWRVESAGYTSIVNNDKFEERAVKINADASFFKVKTAITGHGQDGEFIPRTHKINVDGGSFEYDWSVWKTCGENPVYPQGGTWIYDRAGWCPGMATDIVESDITEFVTPGNTELIDYQLQSASGASDYWVSNQLVSYGPFNTALDLAIIDIKNPSTKVEYARTNSICTDPTIVVQNTGSSTIDNLTIEYWINENPEKQSYQWYGELLPLAIADIVLPAPLALWDGLTNTNDNKFHAEVKNPNGVTDGYLPNNKYTSTMNITNVVPSNFIVWVKTNSAGAETRYKIVNSDGATFLNKLGLNNNTNYRDTLTLPYGCYQFIISDTDDDGIDFWANSDGVGFARFKEVDSPINIKTFEPDFGSSLVYNFTVDFPLAYDDMKANKTLLVFPNPTENEITIEVPAASSQDKYELLDQIGRVLLTGHLNGTTTTLSLGEIPAGVYFLRVGDKAMERICVVR